jgi:hypothetical protein
MKAIILTIFLLTLYPTSTSVVEEHDPPVTYYVDQPLDISLECGTKTCFVKAIIAGNDTIWFSVIVECKLLSNNQYTD